MAKVYREGIVRVKLLSNENHGPSEASRQGSDRLATVTAEAPEIDRNGPSLPARKLRAEAAMGVRAPPNPTLALPRRAERALLHRVLREHLATFLEQAEASGRPVPGFVERELRAFLACGIPAHGFVRVHCKSCGLDRLVPFSCKRRGFCSSCGGRRMAEGAARLVDRVLPNAPARQWVLSLPFALRFRLAWDHRLASKVLAVAQRAILGFQRDRAKRRHGLRGRCGSITVIQRFGSALNLNVHFHSVVLDGVHVVDDDGHARFFALPEPSRGEQLLLVETIAKRVQALLSRHDEQPDEREGKHLMRSCQAASATGTTSIGRRAGARVRCLFGPPPPLRESGSANHDGFDLHVGPRIGAGDRKRLERLCRYALRPPVASPRLKLRGDGRIEYELKHPWRDGTTAVVFEPLELIERLVALIPAPRANLLRYHGSLAPGSKLRRLIVPRAPEGHDADAHSCPPGGPTEPRRPRYSWAELMRRVFERDVLECPRCSGRMRLISTITQPEVIRAILECIGLPPRAPPIRPSRGLEQADFDFGAD
jgi:hypothetical protein